MAFMNQERKAKLAPGIKAVLKKYNAKGTIAVLHNSELRVVIKESEFQVEGNCEEVNEYHIDRFYSGRKAEFLNELYDAMMIGNHNRSDSQTDYFDVGWYISIRFGRWNSPHKQIELV